MNQLYKILISATVVIIIYLPSKAQVFKGLPFITTFGTREYNAGIQNWDIDQDKRGFLYFANNFGLLEYDGDQWKTFPIKTGVKVRCISVAPDGRIYVGLQGDFGIFSPTNNGSWTYTSLADKLKTPERDFDETWRIYQIKDKVYFCTFQNIYVYANGGIRALNIENPIEFSFLANNVLYVLDWENGLMMVKGSSLISMPGGEFFHHKRIISILPYDQQNLLITTQKHGLFLYNGLDVRPVQVQNHPIFDKALLNCAIRLNNGSYIFGSQSSGIFLFNFKLEYQQQIDKNHGLNDHTVLSLFEDKHNNLWVGHNNGISYLELSSPFTLLDEKMGVPGSGYAATIYDNQIYLGTNNGLYLGKTDVYNGLTFQQVKNSEGQVYHISSHSNKLLMGHHNGAFEISGSLAKPLFQETGIWQFKRLQKNPDLMVVGGYYGFSTFSLNDDALLLNDDNSTFDESSRIFEEDSDGLIWMAHGYKGIYKLQLNEERNNLELLKFYGQKDGLPSNVLNNIFKIDNELAFTGETGVYRYNPIKDRFHLNTALTNVFGRNEHIQKLQQDANGRIYFLGSNKMGSVHRDGFGAWEADTSRFNKVHKLINDDLDFLAVLNNQNVLIGAKEGFIHFNPSEVVHKKPAMQVFIRKVSTNILQDSILFAGNFWSEAVLPTQPRNFKVTIPYSSNAVKIEFAAPYFDSPEHISYQYYLEGFEKGWGSWNNQTFKEYTNLPEGKYQFKVRGKNVYGDISETSTFSFAITPPWYRNPWAYLSYSLVGLALIFSGQYYVSRKHNKEKQLLEIKQKKVIQQKNLEIDSISKKSEEEIIKLQNEKLESEIRHKNKELATSTMHIVNKNEFIGEIKHHLNLILKESINKSTNKDIQKIIKGIEQNITTDKDWEHFQFHFDRVHGNFAKRLKDKYPELTPQEMKLCAYLRLNLSTKEIAQLMHISVRGVEISRYRLRKKLNLERQVNLLDYILNY